MRPRIHDALACDPQSEMQIFMIRRKHFAFHTLSGIVAVAISEFEEAQIAFFAVHIVRNAL